MWSSSPVLRGSCRSHCLNWLKTLNSNPLVIVHLNISIISLNKIIVILSWEILGIKVSMPLRTPSKVLNVFTGYIKRTVGLFRSTDFRCSTKFVICWLVKERMTCWIDNELSFSDFATEHLLLNSICKTKKNVVHYRNHLYGCDKLN